MPPATRRSTRIQQKTHNSEAQVFATDAHVNSDRESSVSPPKRQKTARKQTKSKKQVKRTARVIETSTSDPLVTVVARPDLGYVRGRRGFLNAMNEMPLDVVYEIFGQLEPIDLLHLSWACKSLHSIIMGRQERSLWINAVERLLCEEIPPPPCPSDLNLAQYTRFLFGKQCMVCQTGNTTYGSWFYRVKACWDCLQTDYFQRQFGRDFCGTVDGVVYEIKAKGRTYSPRAELDKLLDMDPRKHEDLTKFAQEVKRKEQGCLQYEKWKKNIKEDKKQGLGRMREARQKAILVKLDELGWVKDDILKYLNGAPLDVLPTFRLSAKLTKGDWENTRPLLLPTLEKMKANWESDMK